ncbi:substrate-binding domain-containing protein [Corynebacterium deserti]|uniref:hypothetical protein n=1 Tax=Corynebacterium deserti TaxID=1408191 RepID=UPI000AA86BF4|nr:hypothetical protein [Corynebacterium deserti]
MGQATGAETGTEEKARELIGEYEERVDKLKKQYATVLASHTFAPVSFNGGNFETRPNRLLSVALRDLGGYTVGDVCTRDRGRGV